MTRRVAQPRGCRSPRDDLQWADRDGLQLLEHVARGDGAPFDLRFSQLLAPTATRPFSRDRAGITLGEGSAYVLIEREVDATRHHALARVAGIGAASDAFHHTSPHPEGIGGQLCMRQALDRAGMTPNQIDGVSAHGTGTRLNDAAEAVAVSRVFERPVPITATKRLTGHTLGSAGLTALVLAVESLRRQEIPATLCLGPPDDRLGVEVSAGGRRPPCARAGQRVRVRRQQRERRRVAPGAVMTTDIPVDIA